MDGIRPLIRAAVYNISSSNDAGIAIKAYKVLEKVLVTSNFICGNFISESESCLIISRSFEYFLEKYDLGGSDKNIGESSDFA